MLRKFVRERGGNVAVIFALASLPIMAGVGGTVDYFDATNKAAAVQNALDAAGLAAGNLHLSGGSHAEVASLAEDFFRGNIEGQGIGDIRFKLVDSGNGGGSVPLPEELKHLQGFGETSFLLLEASFQHEAMLRFSGTWDVRRQAVVRISQGSLACVLALDPAAASAIKIQGSTQARFDGCVLAANSTSNSAVYRGGSAQLRAACVMAHGATSGLDSSNVRLDCGQPLHRQAPSRDPLRNVQLPSSGSCQNMPNSRRKTLSPGTYCERRIDGEVTLEPGVYILRGGSINLGGNGSLQGQGVTIILLEGAEMSVGANQVVRLSPPTSGPLAGITIYQAPGNAKTLSLLGTAGSVMSGFIYAPDAHIAIAGNNTMAGSPECLRLVARTIEMTGNSDISSNCEAELGGRKMFAARFVGLVQ